MRDLEHRQTLRGLVPEDLLKFRWLREIVVTPDGARVAYTVSRPDPDRNSYQTDVYLMDPATGWRRKVGTGVGQGSALAFSRDGRHLAYVWQPEDGTATSEVVSQEG
ncbi:MAG: hypothetical protein H5T59_12515, partial [Anaerolineae bacterium]|nr:hypothetical protein [Anaerolineae bacterium]